MNGVWHIKFIRNFGREEEVMRRDLKEALQGVDLTDVQDRVVWCLEKLV